MGKAVERKKYGSNDSREIDYVVRQWRTKGGKELKVTIEDLTIKDYKVLTFKSLK